MFAIEEIKKEYKNLLNQLSDPELVSNWEKFEELSKRKNFYDKILAKEKEIQEIKNTISENITILSAKEDYELTVLAEEELNQLRQKEKILEKELEKELENLRKEEQKIAAINVYTSAIIEIRAGAGGEESALFAADLFKMYSKYGQTQNWKQKILDSHPTSIGGFKEIIFEFKNGNVFSKMKYEAGVHRVQRIPSTEKGGRIHTSTATVAVLPKPTKTEVKIRADELKIDFFRSSGKGGQNVNKRETAVRITHLPTGLTVSSQTERDQLQNKENALTILEARLLEKKITEETKKFGEKRKKQIGQAKRAEKIRTYNFPQDRITDHRLKKSWKNLEKIMQGNLDPVISYLEKSKL